MTRHSCSIDDKKRCHIGPKWVFKWYFMKHKKHWLSNKTKDTFIFVWNFTKTKLKSTFYLNTIFEDTLFTPFSNTLTLFLLSPEFPSVKVCPDIPLVISHSPACLVCLLVKQQIWISRLVPSQHKQTRITALIVYEKSMRDSNLALLFDKFRFGHSFSITFTYHLQCSTRNCPLNCFLTNFTVATRHKQEVIVRIYVYCLTHGPHYT